MVKNIESSYDPFAEMESDLEALERQENKSNLNSVPFRETSDHKNIPLWTPLNKMIPPMHPANARITIKRWAKAGFPLYTRKRTEAEVEAFKKTDFYKKEHKKHLETRALRRKQSGVGKQEKIITDVAKEVAKAVKSNG